VTNPEDFESAIKIVPTRKMFTKENRTQLAKLAATSTIFKIDC